MSSQENSRCFRGINRIWLNIRNLCRRITTRRSRGRRMSENMNNVVSLVRTSRLTPQDLSDPNWRGSVLEVNRAPPRKRFHYNRSPETLLRIKLALQEQIIKDIWAEELKTNEMMAIKMESGENIMEKEPDESKTETVVEELRKQ